jgi:hypothetical protein
MAKWIAVEVDDQVHESLVAQARKKDLSHVINRLSDED